MQKNRQSFIVLAFGVASAAGAWAQILQFFNVAQVSKYGTIGLVCLVCISLASACIVFVYQRKASRTKIRFCIFDKVLPYLPLFLAIEAGFFRKRGLDVEVLPSSHGDKKTWETVENGSAEFGLSDPVVSLHENAKTGRLVATIVNKATICGITKKIMPYYHRISDLPDSLTISGLEEPSTTYRALLKLKEICNARIKFYASGNWTNAIEDENTDIVLLNEPFASEWVKKHQGYSVVLDGSDLFADSFGELSWSGVYCTSAYIDQHPQIVQKVVDSLQEALNCIHKDPLFAQKIAIDIYPDFSRVAVCIATLRMLKVFPENCVTPRDAWLSAMRFWGLGQKSQDFETYVINEFATKAKTDPGGSRKIAQSRLWH
jgi:ABC-type nitrate/sulfonate/bicarbonate transport system substrate-binding protein